MTIPAWANQAPSGTTNTDHLVTRNRRERGAYEVQG